MWDWLTERARVTPQKLALVVGERQWTYGELDTAVSHLTTYLHAQGLRPGDCVAVRLPNSFEYVCLIHALPRLGAILVPLNTRLTPPEWQWQIEHVEAKWLVTDREVPGMVNGKVLMMTGEWFQNGAACPIHPAPFTLSHFQSIVFTSGTSGRPKGARLTFANHFYSAMASAYRLGTQPDDLWLSVLPLYHVGGLAVIWRSCLYGTAVSLHPRFDLHAINHDLTHNPITLISLVPTMLHRLLEIRTHWPASLRLILLGGAAAPVALVQRANALPRHPSAVKRDHLLPQSPAPPLIAPTYGLTEAASQVATMLPAEAARKPGSVGKPLLFTSIKIVDEQGHAQPPGTYGEIVVSGPTVMAGYGSGEWGVGSGEGEFHTGDIGYLDAEGDLFLVQRRSDLIVSGGENVYPAEVEAVLRQHTAVTEACVVGLPDAEWGQRVAAMVQLQPGRTLSEAELLAFCREGLAGYKVPHHIQLVDALPLTASGKIARQQVSEQMRRLGQLSSQNFGVSAAGDAASPAC